MRRFSGILTLLVLGLLVTPPASAGIYDDIFRGLEIFATPSGAGTVSAGNGVRVNGQRLGRIQLQPNLPGDGWDLIVDRTFGPDSSGRPETLDLGGLELTLQGSTATTASITRRGFMTANLDFQASALNYSLEGNTGALDVALQGTLNAQNSLELNQFGFYTLTMNVDQSNSRLLVESLGGTDDRELDFTVGPVNVQGNIFVDLLVGVLNAVGITETPLDQFTGRSGIDELNRSFNDALNRELAEEGLAIETQDGQARLVALADETAMSSTTATLPALPSAGDSGGATPPASNSPVPAIPEPATLLPLAVLLGASLRRR